MNTATIPSLQVDPELRAAAEAVLEDGESLSSFDEQSILDGVQRRTACEAVGRKSLASHCTSRPSRYRALRRSKADQDVEAAAPCSSQGSRVSDPQDHGDLAALLAVYDFVLDAGQLTKAGVGVSHFERRKDQDHPGNTSCFFVVRTDGTSIDFSTRRALDVAADKAP
jgi:hypothetical protein